jgi:hypothetical protein
MCRFLIRRNEALKDLAESENWKNTSPLDASTKDGEQLSTS